MTVQSILDTKRYFTDQKNNIDTYFSYIQSYENNGGKMIVNITQKSSFILLLYNLIESVVTKILDEIHTSALNGTNQYHSLNEHLRRTIFVYYNRIMHEQDIHKYHLDLEKFHLIMNNNERLDLSYENMSKVYPLFSGNLDSKEIRNVLKNKYGFSFVGNELQCPALQKIKNGRNKLAHGEESFEEYGRSLTIQELEATKKEVFNFFDALLIKVDTYLNEKSYLKN